VQVDKFKNIKDLNGNIKMTKIAIIDMDSVLFSIGNGNKVLDEKNEPVKKDGKFVYIEKTELQLIEASDFWMNKILTECGATHYIAYIKGLNTTDSRKNINCDYKSKRPTTSPWYWNFVKEYLKLKWKVFQVNGIEVDDAVNITRLNLENSFIVAIDGDLLRLDGTHYQWRVKGEESGKWITTTKDEAIYKFWSDMIVGQPGDGLSGLKGKGIKYVEDLFTENLGVPIESLVFNEYIQHYGEEIGIEEFYKSYKCLNILYKFEGFEIPSPIEYKKAIKSIIGEVAPEPF
jgi:hypothetical protein